MEYLKYSFFQVDAFTNEPFKGNPAAVVLLEEWLDPNLLQKIGAENNLPETAFLVPNQEGYDIRWFTPVREVPLCGHATLASAYVIFNHIHPDLQEITLQTKTKGHLILRQEQGQIIMDFPRIKVERLDVLPEGLEQLSFRRAFNSEKLILELPSADAIRNFQPDLDLIARLHPFGVAITALSDQAEFDFVSRFFVPNAGIDEDPVTGSLHCALADLWSKRLGKTELVAKQLSKRSGIVQMTVTGDRVLLRGDACLVIKGEIFVPVPEFEPSASVNY